MAKYRFLYLLLYAAAAIFALSYESKLTFVLFLGTAILPAVTFVLMLISRLLLKTEVTPKQVYSRKLENFDMVVKITNRSFIPVSPLHIIGIFQDEEGNVSGGRRLIVSVMPFSDSEYVFGGNVKYRGEYLLGLERAEIYDLLRIFKMKIKLEPDCSAVIAPRRLNIDESSALCGDELDSSVTRVSFMDSSVFASVRKYEDGDLLKHVHWKLSAKQDELMVKQFEQNLGSSAVIITDTRAIYEDPDDNMCVIDAVIESALALSDKIISDGRCAVNIFRAPEGDIQMISAQTHEDYEQLFTVYSVISSNETDKSAAEMICETADTFTPGEPIFIMAPEMTGEELDSILELIDDTTSEIRIYLTGGADDPELLARVEESRGVSVYGIDPDDISLSLRSSMEPESN